MLFGIYLHRRVWVGIANPTADEKPHRHGWRPLIWASQVDRAEKFETEGAAREFASRNLPHEDFRIVPIAAAPPTRGGPGTPLALKAA